LVFSLHLLAVDLAMAGPLVAVWLEWRGARRPEPDAAPIARRLAGWSLAAGIVGIGLGLLALAVLPGGEAEPYRRALQAVSPARWWYVAEELLFYVLFLVAYVGAWRWFQSGPAGRAIHRGLGIIAATDLMYHFPPMFAVLSTISTRPALWGESLGNRPLYWKLLLEGETFSRVVHHWLAAVAVSATVGLLLAAKQPQRRPWFARIALGATVAQLPVGVWVLLSMPPLMQQQLMGQDLLATILFGTSLIAALGLMHHLALISLRDTSRGAVARTAALMLLTVFIMASVLHRARNEALRQLPTARARPSRWR